MHDLVELIAQEFIHLSNALVGHCCRVRRHGGLFRKNLVVELPGQILWMLGLNLFALLDHPGEVDTSEEEALVVGAVLEYLCEDGARSPAEFVGDVRKAEDGVGVCELGAGSEDFSGPVSQGIGDPVERLVHPLLPERIFQRVWTRPAEDVLMETARDGVDETGESGEAIGLRQEDVDGKSDPQFGLSFAQTAEQGSADLTEFFF